MVGMLAKGDRDYSSLRQGSNTKNQDHSWQKSANSGTFSKTEICQNAVVAFAQS